MYKLSKQINFRATQHTSSITFNNISKVFKNSHFFEKNFKNFSKNLKLIFKKEIISATF